MLHFPPIVVAKIQQPVDSWIFFVYESALLLVGGWVVRQREQR